MTPTFTVTGDVLPGGSALVGPAPDGAEPARDEVPRGAGGDGQRDVRLDRVEVLLDDAEDVAAEVRERLEQRRHRGFAVRRLDHHAELDRLRHGQVLRADAFADRG